MATIIDVAKRAGVSTATVSRALNGSANVCDTTKKRILEAIAELDYNPNALGRNLRRMRTGIVLVVLPSISNSFFSQVVKGMEQTGAALSYTIMICTTRSNPVRERMFLDLVRNRQADGAILISSCLPTEELKEFGASYPAVQCSEYTPNLDLPWVSIDNEKAGYDATTYLIQLGHRHIGFIGAQHTHSSDLRYRGCCRALAEQHLAPCPVVNGNFTYQSGYDAAQQLLLEHPTLTALFVVSDVMACAAIRAGEDQQRRVPQDLSVIGVDNIMMSYVVRPTLTTIAQPRYDLGAAAMQQLAARIEHKKQTRRHICMEHTIIKRDSTAAAPEGSNLHDSSNDLE